MEYEACSLSLVVNKSVRSFSTFSIQFNSMIYLRLSHYKLLDSHVAIHTYTRMNNKILYLRKNYNKLLLGHEGRSAIAQSRGEIDLVNPCTLVGRSRRHPHKLDFIRCCCLLGSFTGSEVGT
jgi:hypothetical protein